MYPYSPFTVRHCTSSESYTEWLAFASTCARDFKWGAQVGPFHSCLGFDSWNASGVLRPIRSLTASLTGKMVGLDHVSIPGLVDSWGSLMVCSISPSFRR